MPVPLRGEVWDMDFGTTRGHETRGWRPALVLSVDVFNRSPAALAIVLPCTTKDKGVPLHVRIDPPEGGLSAISYVKVEDIRSLSLERLGRRRGEVSPETMVDIEERIQDLLDL